MTYKYCSKCGNKHDTESNFCSECGEKLNSSNSVTDNPKNNFSKLKSGKSNSITLIGAALLLALIAIYLVIESNRRTYEEKIHNSQSKVSNAESENVNVMMAKIQAASKALEASPKDYSNKQFFWD